MKTSNKLLLTAALSSLGILGLVHLTLYAKYKSGEILTEKDLHAEQFTVYKMAAPEYLSVHGMLRVHIIPSDSFYLEVEKNPGFPPAGPILVVKGVRIGGAAAIAYHVEGDTLSITGDTVGNIDLHENPTILRNLPQVNIYCRHIKEMKLAKGQVILDGDRSPVSSFNRLVLTDALLWIGQFGEWEGSRDVQPAYYDSLSIQAENSTVLLNRYAEVRVLQAGLTGTSELLDEDANIEKPYIRCGEITKLHLTGQTMQRLEWEWYRGRNH